MALNFPSSPSVDDEYTYNGRTWVWDGSYWKIVPVSVVQPNTTPTFSGAIVSANSSTDAVTITQTGTGNALVVEDSTSPDSTPFVIDANGNVRIGTSSPISSITARLSIKSSGDYDAGLVIGSSASAANWARLDFQNTNAAEPTILYQDQGGTFRIRTNGAYPITFSTNGNNERLRIDSSGNVGIGTAFPASKLDVVGGVNATNFVEGLFTLGTVIQANNGSIANKTLTANTTFTENLADGESVLVRLNGGATYTVTWPTLTWISPSGNVAPTLNGINDLLVFWQDSGVVYGAYVGNGA